MISQLVKNVSKGEGLGCKEAKSLMQAGQGEVVIELNVVTHLDNFIEDSLIELGVILEVESCLMVSLAGK